MKKIAVYGAGGFGREIACMIRAINEKEKQWDFVGFFDDGIRTGEKNRYGEVLGGLEAVNNYPSPLGVVISIATPAIISELARKIANNRIFFPNLFAPNVILFDQDAVSIGHGNVVFYGCRISCDVKIGNFNLFNGAVSLGHDVVLGDHNVFGPSTRISGNVVIGNDNFFGVGSIVLQGKKIGNRIRAGANSVIMRNTTDDSLYIGNPAKKTVI